MYASMYISKVVASYRVYIVVFSIIPYLNQLWFATLRGREVFSANSHHVGRSLILQ